MEKYTDVTRSELKSKLFALNDKKIKQELTIELTFTLEIKIQNKHFSEEYHQFFS